MRRRWKAPNDPTPQAKAVWAELFPREDWPKGWRVQWVGFMRGCSGLTIYSERRVLLSWGDRKRRGPLDTLLHEFVHMRAGHGLRHGKEFRGLLNGFRARVGLDPEPEPTPQPPRHRHRYIRETWQPHVNRPGSWAYSCECGFTSFWTNRRPDLIRLAEYAAG